jgi:hypothetical protein
MHFLLKKINVKNVSLRRQCGSDDGIITGQTKIYSGLENGIVGMKTPGSEKEV